MKKRSPVLTIALLLMCGGILAAIFYVNNLLNGQTKAPATQVKKTKASEQTYHKLLALNDIPTPSVVEPTIGGSALTSSIPVPANSSTSVPSTAPSIIPVITTSPPKASAAVPTLLAQLPTIVPTLAIPTAIPTIGTPTLLPTKQPLLAYHNPSPTLLPIADTGGGDIISPTSSITGGVTPSIVPTKTNALPATGWVQTSSILFIVATSTIFLSLLF